MTPKPAKNDPTNPLLNATSLCEHRIEWTLGTIAMSDALDTVFAAYQRGDVWTWGGERMLDEVGYFHFHLIDEAFHLTENHGERIQAELDSFAQALNVQVLRRFSYPSGRKLVLLLPTLPGSGFLNDDLTHEPNSAEFEAAIACNDPLSLTLMNL
jgi:hypothetical protein